MLSQKEIAELQRSILGWLKEDGLDAEPQTAHPDNAFELRVKYPKTEASGTIIVIRPKGRNCVIVLMQVAFSGDDLRQYSVLDDRKRIEMMRAIRKAAFTGGIVGFGPTVEGNSLRQWLLDRVIYDGALNRHRLMSSLRLVFSKHLEIVEVIAEHLGRPKLNTDGQRVTGYG